MAVKVTEEPTDGVVELALSDKEKGVDPTLISTQFDSEELPVESNTTTSAAYAPAVGYTCVAEAEEVGKALPSPK